MPDRSVFRFAPSPNGALHLGHALSALIGHARAKAVGGRFLLRIEDIDVGRVRPEFVAGIFEDLDWLGLEWEEPVLFQSSRMEAYRRAAQRLETLGLLYPCFATRSEIETAAAAGRLAPSSIAAALPVPPHPTIPMRSLRRSWLSASPKASACR